MKTILVEVPLEGNITPYELHRAIANREEYLMGMSVKFPKINNPKPNFKIKEGAGLWNFITMCLP